VDANLDRLSRRERQVFRLLVLGYVNPEIASQLGISVRTVETHRASVQRKLDAPTRARLVQLALTHGLLTP
jgi:DNA-binding CsgD family transcriptional regulator